MRSLLQSTIDYLNSSKQVVSGKGTSMKLSDFEVRKCDSFGCGHFGASRGSRTHNGVDLLTPPNKQIPSPVSGVVTKLGYPYGDDLSFRYVEITQQDYKYRIFYVNPTVKVGDKVEQGSIVGMSQDLDKRYKGIPNHVHFEILTNGRYVDPLPVLLVL